MASEKGSRVTHDRGVLVVVVVVLDSRFVSTESQVGIAMYFVQQLTGPLQIGQPSQTDRNTEGTAPPTQQAEVLTPLVSAA